MSYSPVKFLAGCVVEFSAFAALFCCLPIFSEHSTTEPQPQSAIYARPIALPPAAVDAQREEFVSRTLDSAGQRLAGALGDYLHSAATEVFQHPEDLRDPSAGQPQYFRQ